MSRRERSDCYYDLDYYSTDIDFDTDFGVSWRAWVRACVCGCGCVSINIPEFLEIKMNIGNGLGRVH